jgi:hypothetical protein
MEKLIEHNLRQSLRHVAQTETLIGAQRAKVRTLVARRGDPAHVATAVRVLHCLENTLNVMRGHIKTRRDLLNTLRSRAAAAPPF